MISISSWTGWFSWPNVHWKIIPYRWWYGHNTGFWCFMMTMIPPPDSLSCSQPGLIRELCWKMLLEILWRPLKFNFEHKKKTVVWTNWRTLNQPHCFSKVDDGVNHLGFDRYRVFIPIPILGTDISVSVWVSISVSVSVWTCERISVSVQNDQDIGIG